MNTPAAGIAPAVVWPESLSLPSSVTLPAPAKLNLMLHIVGQREDGYHLLQTQFQFLDFCDQLTFELTGEHSGGIELISELKDVAAEENLIVKAGRQLQRCHPDRRLPDVRITLEKRIPMGGGVGGGSSDCATALIALNYLWQLNMTVDQLAEIGVSLGADVPVFVRGNAAWAEGIGEQLTPIHLPEPYFVVLVPDCHISTPKIFSNKELTRDTKIMKIAPALEQGGHNDCEPIVRSLYSEVDEAIGWLAQFGKAQMTGTGACVFAGFEDEETAIKVLNQKPDSWQGFVAQGKNISPLFNKLSEFVEA